MTISQYAELREQCMWLGTASGPPVRCWLLWQSMSIEAAVWRGRRAASDL